MSCCILQEIRWFSLQPVDPSSTLLIPTTTHQALWTLGYSRVHNRRGPGDTSRGPTSPNVQPCCSATGMRSSYRVLDVGAGWCKVSLPCRYSRCPCRYQRSDTRVAAALMKAAATSLELDWRDANAEALPFGVGEFDALLSATGVLFAPPHQHATDCTSPGVSSRYDRIDQLNTRRSSTVDCFPPSD